MIRPGTPKGGCSCTPNTPVSDLCADCRRRRKTILTRLRNRKARHGEDLPYSNVTIDPDTVETLLRALDHLSRTELDVRTSPFASDPRVKPYLDTTWEIRRYLGGALAEAERERVERDRRTG